MIQKKMYITLLGLRSSLILITWLTVTEYVSASAISAYDCLLHYIEDYAILIFVRHVQRIV